MGSLTPAARPFPATHPLPDPKVTGGERKSRRNGVWILAVLFALGSYGWLLFSKTSFAVGGVDSSGYFNTARLLLNGELRAKVSALAKYGLDDQFRGAFIPVGFVPGPSPGTMAPLYPSGFPLHVAVTAFLFGWSPAPYYVSPLAAVGAVAVLFLLALEFGLSRPAALAGAAVLAACPFFVYQAVQQMSDTVATFWSVLAVLAALYSRRNPNWAILAGASLGIAFLVRPTSMLLLPTLALASSLRSRAILLFICGGLPFVSVFCWYNVSAYGSALQTGYGIARVMSFATAAAIPQRLGSYAVWLGKTLTPLLLLGWFANIGNRGVALRQRLILLVWFAAFLLFYAYYSWGPRLTWWDLRFLLPGLPAAILATLLAWKHFVAGRLARGRPAWIRSALGASVIAIVLLVEIRWVIHQQLFQVHLDQSRYPKASFWAQAQLPANSLVVSMALSGALRFYTELTPARWDWFDPHHFRIVRDHADQRGSPIYALVLAEEFPILLKNCGGTWKQLGHMPEVGLWKLEDSRYPAPAGQAHHQ
jgi:Dolichyl-phosphate-mannose-protein mannosyltransferase